MHEQQIFDGAMIRATLFNGTADKLFVTFRQRVGSEGSFGDTKPSGRFIENDYAHLHIQSRMNDWFINDETEELEAALLQLTSYKRRVGIGFSMGGYGAVRFAPALKLEHLIAVSPQFTIDPAVVPEDRRYRQHAGGFDPVLGRLDENLGLQGALIYDPTLPLDKMHAFALKAYNPNMTLLPMSLGGHPATAVIRSRRRFPKIQKQLIAGQVDCAALLQCHRDCRRESPVYWIHLARRAKRSGRMDVSQFATAKATQLEQDI